MTTTPDAIARAVRALAADGQRGWPQRAGSPPPPPGCVALDYSGLAAIRHLDPASAVVWVEAGATWGEVEATLAPRALTLGPLPAWVRNRPIFQSLAEDDRLRGSPRFGQLTDSLLALRAVLPNGALSRAPTTPRRATGPDLPRSVLGAHHQAGLVTDVHLQAWPRPRAPEVRAAALATFAEALTAAVAVLRAGVRPVGWQVARGHGDIRLTAELATAAEAEIFAVAAGGRAMTPMDISEPDEIKAIFSGSLAEAAACAQHTSGSRLTDIRPEGATVLASRGRPAARTDAWPELAAAVFRRLEGEGR